MTEQKSPSSELAQIVVKRLVEEQLILPEKAGLLVGQLATGNATASDWKSALQSSQGAGQDP